MQLSWFWKLWICQQNNKLQPLLWRANKQYQAAPSPLNLKMSGFRLQGLLKSAPFIDVWKIHHFEKYLTLVNGFRIRGYCARFSYTLIKCFFQLASIITHLPITLPQHFSRPCSNYWPIYVDYFHIILLFYMYSPVLIAVRLYLDG